MTYNSHKAEVLHELRRLDRQAIQRKFNAEANSTVRIWIYQYLTSLDEPLVTPTKESRDFEQMFSSPTV